MLVPIKNFTFIGNNVIITTVDNKEFELFIEDGDNITTPSLVVKPVGPMEQDDGFSIL